MWFIRGIGTIPGSGRSIPVVADLLETSIYPTLFFSYFNNLLTFDVFSDLPHLEDDGFKSLLEELFANKEREEEETPFSNA